MRFNKKSIEENDDGVPAEDASDRAEAIRKKYLYRRLILRNQSGLSRGAAVGLVGPDCAYHLYRHMKGPDHPSEEAGG